VSLLLHLKNDADENEESATWTWKAVAAATPRGTPRIDYAGFAKRWDAEESLPPQQQVLHNLVKRFDGHDITLNTHEPAQDVEKGKPQASQVSKMAKRATAKAMS
jgi:hypothetical protein